MVKLGLTLVAVLTLLSGISCGNAGEFSGGGGGWHNIGDPSKPTIFPLKSGDQIELIAGGRVTLGEESGERTLKATYKVRSVRLDSSSNHWVVDADNAFELMAWEVDAERLKPLFLSQVLPFAQVLENDILKGRASYQTDMTMGDDKGEKAFPFFDFEPARASEESNAFASAAKAFEKRILQIDPEANIRMQSAASRLEAYFKDARFEKPYLHELRVFFSPLGVVSNIEERLQFWKDGMQKNVGAFHDVEISAVFPLPVKITRDGKTYVCSTLNNQCKSTDGKKMCLDRDPSLPPRLCDR